MYQVLLFKFGRHLCKGSIHNPVKQFCSWPKRCFNRETNSYYDQLGEGSQFRKELLLVTDVSTTRARVIFRVKGIVFVSRWGYIKSVSVCSSYLVCSEFGSTFNGSVRLINHPDLKRHYHSLDSEEDFCSGCRNVSHQQQFFSKLHSPGRLHNTNYWYSSVQTIYLLGDRLLKRRVATWPKVDTETFKMSPSKGSTLKSRQMLNLHTAITYL